jgi:SEC-C motif
MNKIGHNALCPCGSGLKYKRCCEAKDLDAELTESLSTLDAHEQAEMLIYDRVYRSILLGVWTSFHSDAVETPSVEAMENFYFEIYGYEFDMTLIDEIVFPLSPEACARLIALHRLEDEKIVDITPEEAPHASPDALPGA